MGASIARTSAVEEEQKVTGVIAGMKLYSMLMV